ncbi:MAG: glycoside hydrolase family 57 protein [Gemmataceae bacterium]|nr:glycoside hydrolase family 57 protein [Gemmataceae bacterium]
MADIALALFWHQHQPYYPDDVSGDNPMPWVRLHGVKDYYGMALHLLEYPEMRCTINLVPSLLVQLLAYTERGASDRPLQVSRRPAADLSEADALYLLDNFFMANHERMIRPWPRYYELLQRRGLGKNSAQEALRRYREADLRDLQVLFNLAWIHPLAFERDAELRSLRAKGRYFTEDDKRYVLDKHLEILRHIIPLHKRLADSGQVELTTTPFYHPILPLLWDKKLAREALPDVKLPRATTGYPEDAEVHVRRAVEFHKNVFGSAPCGLWPAEGSVAQAIIPLLARHGIRWIATDEGVLSHSTQGFVSRDEHGHVRNPSHLYRPYRVREGGHELNIVFRDHALSDLIGFQYQWSQGNEAADDFLKHLHNIRRAVEPRQPVLVTVILDGENCWEHYPDGGVPFLRALYQRCTRTAKLRPVRLGEYLEQHPPRDTLPHLFAGSWINHNFAIWIGHEEDNAAWDALHHAREHLVSRTAKATAGGRSPAIVNIQRAWEELYIAEGSDWFWWYGDDHLCAQDALFDALFRKHLQNVYHLLGDEPPADLARPIKRFHRRPRYTTPRGLLEVAIDGRETFFEWVQAGRYTCHNERGTMAAGAGCTLRELYFGFNREALLVRVDCDRPARQALLDYDALRISFAEPAGWAVVVWQPGRPEQRVEVNQPVKTALEARPAIAVGIDRIAELSIPLGPMGVREGDPLEFCIELVEGQHKRDRAPREGTIHLSRPTADFERIMWDV